MIKVLDKSVADKIAAGEVIERPVSIIKELVENSIDSGADSITCEIKHGGKTYIRVTDNGCGIPKDEVETAFLRHATSKITTARDLDAIGTLGFRGEALASVAAVTHTEFVTKTKDAKMGVKLLIHGSEVIANSGTGCPDGTTIIVTDLFYNTPARRKFLKSDSAESGQIIDFMSQIALAYPKIKFRFINNGNIIFSTMGKGDLLNTILSVYRLSEYRDLVPVDYAFEGNRVYGYISDPGLSKSNRKSQIFFVNGRVVGSKVIEKGINEGYRERLFEGRFPVAFLFIETDPAKLDVNIHPNKKEVRFDNESEIINLVAEGVREALGTKEAVVKVQNLFKAKDAESKESAEQTAIPTHPVSKPQKDEFVRVSRPQPPVTGDSAKSQKTVDIKQILSTKRPSASQVREAEKVYTAIFSEPAESVHSEDRAIKEKKDNLTLQNRAKMSNSDKIDPMKTAEKESEQRKPAISIEKPVMQPFDFDELELTGSIFGTYITAVDEKNFYLIDQHAAHERIFYEKLVGEYLADEKLKQPILTPILIEVPLSVKENEYDWLDSLCEMGFAIEEFGQNSYVIREIPTFMSLSEAEEFAKEYMDNIHEGTNLNNIVVINKLITKSCKSAVKAHDYLSIQEIKALIEQLKTCRNPFSCPHGRPTFIKLSKYEIEKMFKRV